MCKSMRRDVLAGFFFVLLALCGCSEPAQNPGSAERATDSPSAEQAPEKLGAELMQELAREQGWDLSSADPQAWPEGKKDGSFTVWGQLLFAPGKPEQLSIEQKRSLVELIRGHLTKVKDNPNLLVLLPKAGSEEWAPVMRAARELSLDDWRFAIVDPTGGPFSYLYAKDLGLD